MLIKHENTCRTIEEIQNNPEIKQHVLCPSDILINKALKHKIITKLPVNRNFVFFDCESCLPHSKYVTKKTFTICTHT